MSNMINTAEGQSKKDSLIGPIERLDPALDELIHKDAHVSIIAEGFKWSEGPLWVPEKKMLLFSDIPRNSIFKWTQEKGTELYLTPSGYTSSKPRGGETGSNALLLNSKGQLVMCQHGDRRMAMMDAPLNHPAAKFITLADRYNGKRFDSPNDAAFRSNGDLYFTDPPYGLEHYINDSSKEAPYQGVYKVSKDGKVVLLTDTLTRPNGIAFLPGEKSIIVANSDPDKAIWYIYDLDKDGLFINGRIFYDGTSESKRVGGGPDGFKIDRNGNVFSTGPGGIWIFNKNGKVLGKIRIFGRVSNCAFTEDERTLFITADSYVLKADLR
ncbi:MAG: SMP-30/gluconolactonase/LRE family protein [Flavisolibacter sp.]